jgi:TP901 family phage tail tape measure protein
MAYSNTIGILIAAKDEASAVIDKAAVSTKAAAGEVNGLGSASSATGSLLKTGLAVGLLAVVGESANLAIKFQQDMEILHTNAGVAQSSIAGLGQSFLNMAGSVGQTPDQLAQAFYHIASAGTGIWSTAQQLDILKSAAEGAAIGNADLGDTTYALTSAMSSGIGGVKDAAGMMAVLNATVGAGDMKLTDLNAALGTGILSTAATFGISIQSVGTAIATLTDNGESADAAATRLRMTFALMASPSAAATKQLEALGLTAEDAKVSTDGMNAVFAKSGLSTTKLADDLRQPNGITAAMQDLKDHLEAAGLSSSETDAMLSKAFGGGRTDAALLTMLNNLDRMGAKFTAINKNASDFTSNYAAQQATDAQKIKDAWAGIQADLTQLGSVIAPLAAGALTDVANGVSGLFNWYGQLSPVQKTVLGDLGSAALGLAGTVLAVQGIAKSISAVKDAFNDLTKAKDWVGSAADAASTWVGKGVDVAKGWASNFKDMVTNASGAASDIGKSAASTAKSWVSAASDGVTSAAKTAAGWVVSGAKATASWVGDAVPKIISAFSLTALKSYVHAADVGLAWTINAVRVSFVWVTQELPKLVVGFATTSKQATIKAAETTIAWVASAAKTSFAWVTTELPKIVTGFITVKSGAVKEALETAAAWVVEAAKTSFAWVVTELPKIVTGFITTKSSAILEAGETAIAWVASSSKVAIAWVVNELPGIITGFIAVKAAAILEAGETTVAWATSAATTSKTFTALSLLISTPMVMPAIAIAAALFALKSVWDAANQVVDAIKGVQDAQASSHQTTMAIIAKNTAVQASGVFSLAYKATYQKLQDTAMAQDKALGSGSALALGTSFASGGMTLVGENGPELVNLPRGSQVNTAQQTKTMGGGGTQIVINGGMNINNQMDEQKFLANLGWRLSLR